jgi:pyruvate ferredoxin oxidoreductase beta subunit
VATACPSYPLDLIQKVKKAADTKGAAYIHILSVCPTGWRSAPDLSIKLGRLAVETGTFPLYEVEQGKYRLSIDFPKLKPIKEYIKLQGRFRHLTDEMIEEIQKRIIQDYEVLRERAKRGF